MSLVDRTLLLAVAGSRAQGMHVADSDVDLRGVAVPTVAALLGYRTRWEQADQAGEMDVYLDLLTDEERAAAQHAKVEGTVYALAKFVRLATACNPNILEVLFCRPDELRIQTPLGARLRAERDGFLSARAKETFGGYALQQLKRIEAGRGRPLDPESRPRDRIVAAHGYDTKHAAHLIRLLRMGREVVETGQVHVWRGGRDADELRAIRGGAWSYDALMAEAQAEMAALDAVTAPAVPEAPDHDALDALVIDLHRRALAGER